MRLLGGLGLLAPICLLVVWIANPGADESWTDDGTRSVLSAVLAGTVERAEVQNRIVLIGTSAAGQSRPSV
jgi:CHASE2 domain-containing sensor protein